MSAEAILQEIGELREYAESLERRIKEQREQIKSLTDLRDVAGRRKARKRIADLEQLVGRQQLRIERQKDTIGWFVGKYGDNPERDGTTVEAG